MTMPALRDAVSVASFYAHRERKRCTVVRLSVLIPVRCSYGFGFAAMQPAPAGLAEACGGRDADPTGMELRDLSLT